MFNFRHWFRRPLARRAGMRGQAAAEYTVLVPAGIMIAIAAGTLAGFINQSLQKTVDALNVPPLCEPEQQEEPDTDEGPTVSHMGDHTIRATGRSYNAADNTTTITYTVTSGDRPSISHWVLGLPRAVADSIQNTSEAYEWTDNDPRTGLAGIKFDTGYEVSFHFAPDDGLVLSSYPMASSEIDTVSRDIMLLVSGQYTFEPSQITIKAGGDVHQGTITMPVRIDDGNDDNGGEECVG